MDFSKIRLLIPLDRINKLPNWVKRITFGTILGTSFLIVVVLGPIMIMLICLLVQVLCFKEIMQIGYAYNRFPNLPGYRTLCWYFLLTGNYFLLGEMFLPHFENFLPHQLYYVHYVWRYHRFISFCAYMIGLVWFILQLGRRRHQLKQYGILAWTHTLLIIIVLQSYMVIANIFQGLIWFLLPAFLVVLNDIFAYVFGRAFGKTPLIQLSPNKTWEGFIGGGIGTLVFGLVLSHFLCGFQYFVCPIEYVPYTGGVALNMTCTPNELFVLNEWGFYGFDWHFLAFALFASCVAPFGGFCASGFKRGVHIKDFSQVIPGHGGIMDRFDCQYLMNTFVNVYIFTFVRRISVEKLFRKITYLDTDKQLELYYLLLETVVAKHAEY